MIQIIRQGEQDDVEHDPVRQDSSLVFIRGSLSCSESDVFDVMSASPSRMQDRVSESSGNFLSWTAPDSVDKTQEIITSK